MTLMRSLLDGIRLLLSSCAESSELCLTWNKTCQVCHKTFSISRLPMLHNHLAGNRDPALIALGGNLTRLTARALMYLVLVPSNSLSPHTPLRRAAIDLIGRGFVLWEPHLEVSKVLLGLLDMSSEAAMWVPSQKYGLPLTPVADCCRTARHTLATIALARPGVFITSVSKEIARYNTMATNSQTLNINMAMHVLSRSKAEILHVVEQLIATDTALHVMRDLLTDVLDIILHCVDHNHLKQKALSEVFPPIQTFNQVKDITKASAC